MLQRLVKLRFDLIGSSLGFRGPGFSVYRVGFLVFAGLGFRVNGVTLYLGFELLHNSGFIFVLEVGLEFG